ncbi:MAG: phosphoribosyltransferase family protein [Candidatus Levyibacteriota bacterium]
MTSPIEREQVRNPEVRQILETITPMQRAVAEMMLTAQVEGKLVRRFGAPGNYTYSSPEDTERIPMITIAQNEHEFVGAANYKDESLPLLSYFANLRGGTPENYDLMARSLADTEIPFDFDYVIGIPTTGNYIAEPFARIVGVPYIPLLKKTASGEQRAFVVEPEGKLPEKGMKGLGIDDLITSSKTKDDAGDALTAAGLEVAGFGVVYDRQEGGVDQMKRKGKKIFAAVNASQVFAVALMMGKINELTHARLMESIEKARLANSLRAL